MKDPFHRGIHFPKTADCGITLDNGMEHEPHNSIVNFIWGIADDVLRDVYVRGKYRDVILPMTVIRRLDALLEPSKEAVLQMKDRLDKAKITQQGPALRKASEYPFYNTSAFTLRRLRDNPKQLRQNFEDYPDRMHHDTLKPLCKKSPED